MNYEQMYKESLERAKNGKPIDEIFPELKESKDEKIRKEMLAFCERASSGRITIMVDKDTEDFKSWIAWLKKRGEQKPYTFNAIPRLLEMIKPTDKAKAYCQKLIDSLEKEGYKKDAKIVDWILKQWNGEEVPMATMDEQKPVEWSEEDEKIRKELIFYFGDMPEDTELRNGVTNRDALCWFEKQDAQTIKEALRTEYEKGRYDMREQIMKEAIHGEVMQDTYSRDLRLKTANLKKHGYEFGQKVKIVIIKED